MEKTPTVLIVHESALLRECLASALSAAGTFQATPFNHADSNWDDLVELNPTVIIVDLAISGADAKERLTTIRSSLPESVVIALVSEPGDTQLIDAISLGVTVCVSARASLEELSAAIDCAIRRESYCSAEIADGLMNHLNETGRASAWADQAMLTVRELEVLKLIADCNFSNKEIAKQLSLSLYTVKNHVHNILEKLSVQNRHSAAAHVRRHAWT
jgi:DNA-binding NarL/FixJ family response regulator